MAKLQINDQLVIEIPEEYVQLNKEEMEKRFPGKVDIVAFENKSVHQNIIIQWHKSNRLLLAISDLNSMVKQNAKYTKDALSGNDFAIDKYISGELKKTNYIGYIATFNINGTNRYMKSIFFKRKGFFQSISLYKDDSDFSIFNPIIESIEQY